MKNFFTLLLMSFVAILFAAVNTTTPAFASGLTFASGLASEHHTSDVTSDLAPGIARTSEVELITEVELMTKAALTEPEENSKTVHQFEMKNITGESEALSAGSDPMGWARQGLDALYFAFLLIAIGIVAIAMTFMERNPHGCAHPRKALIKVGRRFMRAWDSFFHCWKRIGIKDNSCLPHSHTSGGS